jgi:hypothetical protein
MSYLPDPMTTLGDIIYENGTPEPTSLSGNITTTKMFLTQTGTGTTSAPPSWGTILASDIPTLNQNTTGTAANVTGVVAVTNGGTGSSTQNFVDLSSTQANIAGSKTFTSPLTVNSTSSTALAVGPNGSTNPALTVNSSAGSSATGISINSGAAGSGVTVKATSSSSNENLTIDALGAGAVAINSQASSGSVTIGSNANPVVLNGNQVRVTTANASALTVAVSGGTNPQLKVNTSATNVATGLQIVGAAAGSGVALSAISSGTSENVTLNALGTGTLSLNNTATGPVVIGGGLQLSRIAQTTGSYTVTTSNCIVAYTALASSSTVTLPTAVGCTGQIIIIKDESGLAATYNLTVATTLSQTIDGASTKAISANYGDLRFYSNGSNWFSW